MSLAVVEQLRGQISAMQGGPTRLTLPMLPMFDGLVQLRTGGSYAVESASLAMALAAGASKAGEWIGFAGWDDFGAEAAHQLGIDLSRTVVVPAPGEHWLEVAAALVDVLKVVVLRPTGRVDPKSASILDARLRARSGVLVVHGDWPRCDARLTSLDNEWSGVGQGAGRLRSRRMTVSVDVMGRPRARGLDFPLVG